MHELCSAPVGVAHVRVSYHEQEWPPNTIGPVELAAHTVVVPTHPLRLPFSLRAPDGDAHASIHRPFSLLPISRPATPGTSEGFSRCWVSTSPTSKLSVS